MESGRYIALCDEETYVLAHHRIPLLFPSFRSPVMWPTFKTEHPIVILPLRDGDLRLATLAFGFTVSLGGSEGVVSRLMFWAGWA